MIPDLPPALAQPTALCCLPSLEAEPWHLGWVTSPDRGGFGLSSPGEEGEPLPWLDAAASDILIALPVAVFPSQRPGFPPAAWTPARLPTALH